MGKFDDMLQKEPSLGYVFELARESEKMLQATVAGNTEEMSRSLEYAHNTEKPLLSYHHETELTAIANLVYLAARDFYRIERGQGWCRVCRLYFLPGVRQKGRLHYFGIKGWSYGERSHTADKRSGV